MSFFFPILSLFVPFIVQTPDFEKMFLNGQSKAMIFGKADSSKVATSKLHFLYFFFNLILTTFCFLSFYPTFCQLYTKPYILIFGDPYPRFGDVYTIFQTYIVMHIQVLVMYILFFHVFGDAYPSFGDVYTTFKLLHYS